MTISMMEAKAILSKVLVPPKGIDLVHFEIKTRPIQKKICAIVTRSLLPE
jgi:hypothetical protein